MENIKKLIEIYKDKIKDIELELKTTDSVTVHCLELITVRDVYNNVIQDLEKILCEVPEEKEKHCRRCIHDNPTGFICAMGMKITGKACIFFK